MQKLPRVIAIILVVSGVVMIGAGATTYYLVHRELADEKIVVSDDAETLAGDDGDGPCSAYSEATVIKTHAAEIADGLTYAQLDREDPRRETVMTSSFLRASLFTSVVAFGVSALVVALGVLFILVGVALMALAKRDRVIVEQPAPDPLAPPEVVAAQP
jgi:hypothetical protein